MDKLNDPNPYEILEISPNADRAAIKVALAARQRKNKTQLERQQALQARNVLYSPEKRLVADALTPTFLMHAASSNAHLEVKQKPTDVDWREIADPAVVLQADLEALIKATIQHTVGTVEPPETPLNLLTEFDGLDSFLNEWLNQ
jgi:hypothetical protein